MSALTRKDAVELARRLADGLAPLVFDESDVLQIVEIEKRQGVYVEVYVGRLWSSLVQHEGPGVSVLTFERIGDTWHAGAGSTVDAQGPGEAGLAKAAAFLEAQRSHSRPKPVRAAPQARPEPGPRLSEAEGAGSLAATVVTGEARRSTDAEVDAAEAVLGVRFPAGYRTFVVALGRGVYGTNVRVYPPERAVSDRATWRARIEQYWFWGDTPLAQADALECICFADTIAGDELIFHPSDPDAILLLPRESERSELLGRGLAAALAKLVELRAPELEAY